MLHKRFLALSLFLGAAPLAAPMATLVSTPAKAEEEKKQKTELHHKMESIDEGMKKLKRTIRKPDQNEVSIKVTEEIIETAKQCREMIPSFAAKVPEADRPKFIEGYQKSMTHLIETMEEMKKALAAGDNDKAKALHKTLKNMEEEGHDKYMDGEDAAKAKDKPEK